MNIDQFTVGVRRGAVDQDFQADIHATLGNLALEKSLNTLKSRKIHSKIQRRLFKVKEDIRRSILYGTRALICFSICLYKGYL